MQCWKGQGGFAGWALGQGCEAFSSCRCGTDVKKLLCGQDSLNPSEINETLFSGELFFCISIYAIGSRNTSCLERHGSVKNEQSFQRGTKIKN